MNETRQHRFTAVIADAEPIVFGIDASEESIYRRAAYGVNDLWRKMQTDQPGKSSHYALAKVALAFAELYYRKKEELENQSKMIEEFEKELDELVVKID